MANAYTQATGIHKVVAWRLTAPSTSGGKVYSIAVVGTEVWTAWGQHRAAGPSGAGSQAKIIECASPAAADDWAWKQTLEKQEKGYRLDIAPRAIEIDVARYTVLGVMERMLKLGEPINIYS
jgi:predicted DNA-binding WGR domain protein